ncbi:MAG: hypothetical protein KF914_12650 [Rhizobiaceae bacterium]|nr:hypothetical protein [Rhizobiaceae bacterium]
MTHSAPSILVTDPFLQSARRAADRHSKREIAAGLNGLQSPGSRRGFPLPRIRRSFELGVEVVTIIGKRIIVGLVRIGDLYVTDTVVFLDGGNDGPPDGGRYPIGCGADLTGLPVAQARAVQALLDLVFPRLAADIGGGVPSRIIACGLRRPDVTTEAGDLHGTTPAALAGAFAGGGSPAHVGIAPAALAGTLVGDIDRAGQPRGDGVHGKAQQAQAPATLIRGRKAAAQSAACAPIDDQPAPTVH